MNMHNRPHASRTEVLIGETEPVNDAIVFVDRAWSHVYDTECAVTRRLA